MSQKVQVESFTRRLQSTRLAHDPVGYRLSRKGLKSLAGPAARAAGPGRAAERRAPGPAAPPVRAAERPARAVGEHVPVRAVEALVVEEAEIPLRAPAEPAVVHHVAVRAELPLLALRAGAVRGAVVAAQDRREPLPGLIRGELPELAYRDREI